MSLILDALKRADAQRERSATPGVLTQPAAVLMPQGAGQRSGLPQRPWLLAAGALAVGLAALLAWQWRAAEKAPESRAAAPSAPLPAPAPALAPVPAPVPITAVPAPTPAPAPAPLPALAPAPVPAAAALPRPAPSPAPAAPLVGATRPPVAVAPAAAAALVKPASAAPEAAAFELAQLPATIRQQLPALTVSGSTYSSNPAHRMLIINGQVLREGDAVSDGQTLEQIRQNAAVLNFKGTRYLLKY